jgi:uncharacterized protein YjbI with pentapeptide repeats
MRVSTEANRASSANPDALQAIEEYSAAHERGEYRVLRLPGANLREIDVSGLDLDECDLTGAVLDGARFVGASLVRSQLVGASLLGADLSYANLDRANLETADATAASFVGATLRRADLSRCTLERADLSDADLSRANLFGSNLAKANLSGAITSQTNLQEAILEDAVLTAIRGEPFFDPNSSLVSSEKPSGWWAVKLAEPQLVQIAGSYLSTQGWGIRQLASWRDEGVDLVAHRDDVWLVIQAKATATPSPQTFTHWAKRMKRIAEQQPNVHLVIVLPGPVSQSLRDVALDQRIGVLSVRVEHHGMQVEEIVEPATGPLAASA